MKIYYQYSFLKTLTPTGGDQINEIGICTALSQFAEVYYSGQLFKPHEPHYGLEEYEGDIKIVDADISIIRANRDVFLKAKGKRIWVSSPYDKEMFTKANYIGTFTDSWTKALKEGETYQNLNPGIKWPNVITLYQTLNPKFKPLQNHEETLKIKENYKNKFIIGVFGRIVKSNYPELVVKALKSLNSIGCEVIFSTNRQLIQLPKEIKIKRFKHSKMPYAINACDCVIISQHGQEWEICGSLKTLEPMACGIPVILERSRAREEMFGKDYPLFLERGSFTPSSGKETDLIQKIKLLFNQRFKEKISKDLIRKAKFYSVKQSAERLEELMRGL